MRVKQTVLTSSLNTDSHQDLAPLKALSANIILVFGDVSFFQAEEGSKLIEILKIHFPQATRLGCSTAGEIAGNQFEEHTLVITAIQFDTVQHEASHAFIPYMNDTHSAGKHLAEQFSADTKAVLVLAPGTHINGSALIKGIKQQLPDISLTGGLAGDGGAFSMTYTLFNESISDRQAVALGLRGDSLKFSHGSFGGWQPFGPPRRVTRCENNILYELDGEPAITVYKHYLGEHAKGLPTTSLLFPFAILDDAHQNTGLIRTILGIDETKGALILAGDIQNNSYLKLMHASTTRLVEGASTAAENLMHRYHDKLPSAGLGLLISCVGRKLAMGNRVDEELEAVEAILPPNTTLCGFYSYGEISPYHETNECKLHNQTMTITYLNEL